MGLAQAGPSRAVGCLVQEVVAGAAVCVPFLPPGVAFLYMKTVERSHQPAKMWERVRLSKHYETALKQVCCTFTLMFSR